MTLRGSTGYPRLLIGSAPDLMESGGEISSIWQSPSQANQLFDVSPKLEV